MKKKTIVLILACMMVLGVALGGTLAWLTDETVPVVNTFTVGDINIELKEHDYDPDTRTLGTTEVTENNDYGFVPGDTLPKDPFVRVLANSEDCWVFVKIAKEANTADLVEVIRCEPNSKDWTPVEDQPDYYYRLVTKSDEDQTFYILAGDQITVDPNVTKAMVDSLKANPPRLIFTAAAVQSDNLPAEDGKEPHQVAWEKLPADFKPATTP